MKPIAFFFTQYIDYAQLMKEQSEIKAPSVYQSKRR